MRRKLSGGLLLALATVFPGAARAEVVTLESLEKSVLERRPAEVDAARARATEADVRKVASGYYPRIGVSGDTQVTPGATVVRVTGEDGKDYWVSGAPDIKEGRNAWTPQVRSTVAMNAQANLYDFGRTRAAVQAGEAAKEAALANGKVTEESLVRSVRGAYLVWLGAHEGLRLAQLGRDDADKRAARVRALVAEGVRPGSDVAPAETELLLAELELTRARGSEEDARLVLAHAAATPLASGAEPDLTLLARELPGSPELEDDATYQALSLQRQAALSNARAAKKERLPALGAALTVGARNQTSDGSLKWFPTFGAGVSLSVPLWDGGMANATSEAARARGDELDARMRERVRERKFVDERARRQVEQAMAELTIAEGLLAQCQKRLAEAEEGYKASAFGIDQVYQARAMLRRAETAVLEARLNRTSAVLDASPIARK